MLALAGIGTGAAGSMASDATLRWVREQRSKRQNQNATPKAKKPVINRKPEVRTIDRWSS